MTFIIERADSAAFTGDVVERIKRRIDSSDLVVADLTTANPNVYLEVGYAWGCKKPTIFVIRSGEELKFDVQTQRCVVYESIRSLEEQLKVEIAALQSTVRDG